MAIARTSLAIAVLTVFGAEALSGDEALCIGPRGHAVTYDFDGDSMENIRDVEISVTPDESISCALQPGKLTWGLPAEAHKTFCVGANVDASCSKAAKNLPLNAYLDCNNCFAGATTDLFYTLSIRNKRLNEVRVGFRNTSLRAAVDISSAVNSALLPEWTAKVGGERTPVISFKVAKIFPVTIGLTLDTELSTSPSGTEPMGLTNFGAHLDLNFGDHAVGWVRGQGFGFVNSSAGTILTPIMEGIRQAETELTLGIYSRLSVDIAGVLNYGFNISAPVFMKVDVEQDEGESRLCVAGGASLEVSHEVDLRFSLLGMGSVEIGHYGPKHLYHYQNSTAFHKCTGLPSIDGTEGHDGSHAIKDVVAAVEDVDVKMAGGLDHVESIVV